MKHNISLKIAVASAALLLTVCSCQKESFLDEINGEAIQPVICTEGTATKAAGMSMGELSWTAAMDDKGLMIQEFVSDNISQPFELDNSATKGTVVTTGNISTVYGEFGMEGFLDNYTSASVSLTNGDQYINAGKAKYNSGDWVLTDGSGNPYPWLHNILYSFWSYAPKTHLGTYTYGSTGSRHSASIANYVNPLNSADQKDVLFAYNNRWYNDSDRVKTIDIHFRHALATVLFDVSAIKDVTVTKIEIKGAYGKGSCAISGEGLADDDVTKAFDWTLDKSVKSTFVMNGATDTFFMIPQRLPEGAALAITLDKSGTPINLEKSFATTWLPGKEYKYVLRYDGLEFEFSIEEEDAYHSFKNTTTDSVVETIPVSSIRSTLEDSDYWDWTIDSYQIGSESPVPVGSTSFTDKGGLTIYKDGTNLKVKALKRTGVWPGSHSYWTGDNGGWSPADWTSSTASSPIDLSKFDYATDASNAHTMTTANCYVIRHGGTYMLPLVYGNAIQNGETNEESYYPDASSGGYSRLERFVNHLGNGIQNPFIENNTSSNYPRRYINAAQASIVWQDKQTVIKDVQIVGTARSDGAYNKDNVRYLKFTVDQNAICQNNAILAIKDGDGRIIWSWHIWTTNDPALLTSPISVINKANNEYKFFPIYTLGWLSGTHYPARDQVKIVLVQADSGKKVEVVVDQPLVTEEKSSGVFYQWGRKDPMPSMNVQGFTTQQDNWLGVALSTAIQNPGTFYLCINEYLWPIPEYDWCSYRYYNLWTGRLSRRVDCEENDLMIKTIYDPSPVGYKVPAPNAYTGFTATGEETKGTDFTGMNIDKAIGYDYGYHFYTRPNGDSSTPTIFFPAVGDRDYSHDWGTEGTVWGIGEDAYYWTSARSSWSDWDIKVLNFLPLSEDWETGNMYYNVNPSRYRYTSNGFAVRPVTE